MNVKLFLLNIKLLFYSYQKIYTSKKNNNYFTIWYCCLQNHTLTKRPRKNENKDKQRNRESINRFNCNGILKISINMKTYLAIISL